MRGLILIKGGMIPKEMEKNPSQSFIMHPQIGGLMLLRIGQAYIQWGTMQTLNIKAFGPPLIGGPILHESNKVAYFEGRSQRLVPIL
jgi:hypothetical protein